MQRAHGARTEVLEGKAAASRAASAAGLDSRGIVMAEFLIALFPVMLAFLGFTQFCFMGIAKLAVRHSAVLAARAAVVVIEEADGIPGAPVDVYGGFPAGGLEIGWAEATDQSAAQDQVAGVSETAAQSASTRQTMDGLLGSYDRTSTRLKQIRTAAYWPLLAISPSLVQDGVDITSGLSHGELFPKMRVRSAIGNSDASRILGAFLYNLGAVAVSFPTALGSDQLRASGNFDGPTELVTTRVSYLFRCQVPFVSVIMCASGWSMMFGDAWVDPFMIRSIVKTVGEPPRRVQDMPAWVDDWKRTQSMHEQLQRRVDAFSGRKNEFDQVEWPFMLDVLLAWPGSRYLVLSAEAELPLQGARYYPRVSGDDMDTMRSMQQSQQSSGQALPNLREALTPIGDGVKEAAQAVDSGMTKVSEGVDRIRGLRDEYIGQLQSQAQGYVSDVRSQASGYISDLSGAFDQYNTELNDAAADLGSSVGSAVGGSLGELFNSNMTKQAASGAKQVMSSASGYAGDLRSQAAGLAGDIKDEAKGMGADAAREARRSATAITKTGNAYAKDIKNAGSSAADAITQTGRGYADELLGTGAPAGGPGGSAPSRTASQRGSQTSRARNTRPSARQPTPGAGQAPAGPASVPRSVPSLGVDDF